MDNLAILNMPAVAPPRQADGPAPAQQQTSGKPEATGFAAELDRQIAANNNATPGPGRDAGKGRETGESAPETETTEQKPLEGQSSASGTEAGSDRLALVAQLAAAAMVAEVTAPQTTTDATVTASTEAATATGAAVASTTTAASASIAGVPTAVTPMQNAAVTNASTVDTAKPAVTSHVSDAAPQATEAATATPVITPNAADAGADTRIAYQQATTTAETAQTGADAATAPTGGGATAAAELQAVAAQGEAPTAVDATKIKTTPAKPATDKAALPSTGTTTAIATPVASGPAPQASNSNTSGDQSTKGEPGQASGVIKAKPTAKGADASQVAPAQTDSGAASDELARLAGHQPGATTVTTAASVAGSDKAPISQPMAHSVIDQMVAGAKMLRQGPVTEMRLQLKPEFLGRVDLKVTMEGGVLSARITVADPQVKAAIEANLSQLKQDLAQQGIALQGMTVGLGGGRNQQAGDLPQRDMLQYGTRYQSGRSNAPVGAASVPQRAARSGHRLDLVL